VTLSARAKVVLAVVERSPEERIGTNLTVNFTMSPTRQPTIAIRIEQNYRLFGRTNSFAVWWKTPAN